MKHDNKNLNSRESPDLFRPASIICIIFIARIDVAVNYWLYRKTEYGIVVVGFSDLRLRTVVATCQAQWGRTTLRIVPCPCPLAAHPFMNTALMVIELSLLWSHDRVKMPKDFRF